MIKRKYNNDSTLFYPLMNPNKNIENMKDYFGLEQPLSHFQTVPLYIHIPFCSKICDFCIFYHEHLGNDKTLLDQYVQSLKKEIIMWGDSPYVQSLKIKAIFFGGGTPTCLSAGQIEEILETCRNHLSLASDVEITVECDIRNTEYEKVHRLRELGVNRISTGIQTFNAYHRRQLGLESGVEKIIDWINNVSKYSFDVVSIDLMYNLPGQTVQEWIEDLQTGLSLPIDHFSLYEIFIASSSKLYQNLMKNNNLLQKNEDDVFRMYAAAQELLNKNGFNQCILADYHKKDKRAEFWELTYSGFGNNLSMGASSHGFINGINYQNLTDVNKYIQALSENRLPIRITSDKATRRQMMERTMILGIRRKAVNKNRFFQEYKSKIEDEFPDVIDYLKREELIVEKDEDFVLTQKGEYLYADIGVMFMESTFRNVSPIKKRSCLLRSEVPN